MVVKIYTTNNMQEDKFEAEEIEANDFLIKMVVMKFPKNIRNRFIQSVYRDIPTEAALNDAFEKYARMVKAEVCYHLELESNETDVYIEFIPNEDGEYDDTVLHEIHVNNEPKQGLTKMWKILSSNSKRVIGDSVETMIFMDGLLPHSIEEKERLVNLAIFSHRRVFRISENLDVGES
jgi:hypothetical protein